MSCNTCDHTMESIRGGNEDLRLFLCPRCGTVKIEDANETEPIVYVPKLVERCREFERRIGIRPVVEGLWHSLGIRESINRPEERR